MLMVSADHQISQATDSVRVDQPSFSRTLDSAQEAATSVPELTYVLWTARLALGRPVISGEDLDLLRKTCGGPCLSSASREANYLLIRKNR